MIVAVFCGSSTPHNDALLQAASNLGASLATAGHTLVYGGSNLGLMGAVSGAALAAGGRVVGVIPSFFGEAIISSQPVSQLVRVADMAERKAYILSHSEAFIALPGGIGTLDEVSEVMVANQLRLMAKPMVLLNLGGFYDAFLSQLDCMRSQGFLRTDCGLRVAASVEQCLTSIL